MGRLFVLFLFLTVLGIPLACTRPPLPTPIRPSTPTPTPTVSLDPPVTASPTSVPCDPIAYRTLSAYPLVQGYRVVDSQEELDALWQEAPYGIIPDPTPTLQVDFAAERVVSHGIYSSNGCVGRYSLVGVCEEPDRVVVTERALYLYPTGYPCFLYVSCTMAIVTQNLVAVIPASDKPVVWRCESVKTYGEDCLPLAVPVTTVSDVPPGSGEPITIRLAPVGSPEPVWTPVP